MTGTVTGFMLDVHPQESEDLYVTARLEGTHLVLLLRAYIWLKIDFPKLDQNECALWI